MFSEGLKTKATELLEQCRKRGFTLATAESCTGGLIAGLLTDIAGSSDVFERGFITYSYRSKTEQLGVDAKLLEQFGAVSDQVVSVMAREARLRSGVDISVAVSGIAGPGGAVPGKPVGTVYIGVSGKVNVTVQRYHFEGDRSQVRMQTVEKALDMIKTELEKA